MGTEPDLIYPDYDGKCLKGYFCPEGSPIMIPCTPGYICDEDNLATPKSICPKGYYCLEKTDETTILKKDCPRGYYCEDGSPEPIPCPAGTISNQLRRE